MSVLITFAHFASFVDLVQAWQSSERTCQLKLFRGVAIYVLERASIKAPSEPNPRTC